MRRIIILAILFIVAVSSTLSAGTTGTIGGRVKDQDGNDVPFATVILKNDANSYGAMTDERGVYKIINVAPGVYYLSCQSVGYHDFKMEGVEIQPDVYVTQNIKVVNTTIKVEGKIFKYDKKKVDTTNTKSERKIEISEEAKAGATDVADLIDDTAGVQTKNGELIFRGGRAGEVQFNVDGLATSDPVDGGAALQPDMDAVASMSVITGGLTAEYGNAQSGVVNVVTKDGSSRYEGKIEWSTDHLYNGADWWADNSNMDEMKFAIGGPLLTPMVSNMRDKLTFFFNGGAQWTDGRFKDYYITDPYEDFTMYIEENGVMREKHLLSASRDSYIPIDPYADRDEFIVDLGNRNYNTYQGNLKVKYQLNNTTKFTFRVSGEENRNKPFSWAWRYALSNYAETAISMRQYIVTLDKTLGKKGTTNLKVKASQYTKKTKQNPIGIDREDFFTYNPANFDSSRIEYSFGLWRNIGVDYFDSYNLGLLDKYFDLDEQTTAQDNYWGYQKTPDGPFNSLLFVNPSAYYDNFIDDETTITQVKADLELNPNEHHVVKTGLEIIKNKIVKDQWFSPEIVDGQRMQRYLLSFATPIDTLGGANYIYSPEDYYAATVAAAGYYQGYEANPYQFGMYLQDRITWDDLIVNAGARFDVWYLGTGYDIKTLEGTMRESKFDKDDRLQLMISPRFGISHAISEKASLRFAYNYQSQLPEFKYVFTTSDTLDALSQPGSTVGNPALDPRTTITYEVGLAQELTEDLAIDVSAYYKNTYNYVSSRKVYSATDDAAYWYEYISEDYASAKGLDITLDKSPSNFWSGTISYSLGWAQGNSSSTPSQQDETTSLKEYPLDWDTRHTLNLTLTHLVKNDEEFYLPYLGWRVPMDDYSVSFTYGLRSGTPYTPQTENGNPKTTNSARMDWSDEASLKFNKTFKISDNQSIKMYMRINNLFNDKEPLVLYPITGDVFHSGVDLSEPNQDYVAPEAQFVRDLYDRDPTRLSAGRTIVVGISYHF